MLWLLYNVYFNLKDRLLTLLAPSQGLSVISVQIYINEMDIHINQTWN